ncbi:hypothetical protein CDAR_454881 [Caerostris darwini]|uniref:Uncharacterized protein n=1 Tax=Caerostris darwini TaxID=1538125 RepID=A0AAV4TZ24_9ARAC|nr:hypothetical protein CDAR_454881 [Caerostris darwini]
MDEHSNLYYKETKNITKNFIAENTPIKCPGKYKAWWEKDNDDKNNTSKYERSEISVNSIRSQPRSKNGEFQAILIHSPNARNNKHMSFKFKFLDDSTEGKSVTNKKTKKRIRGLNESSKNASRTKNSVGTQTSISNSKYNEIAQILYKTPEESLLNKSTNLVAPISNLKRYAKSVEYADSSFSQNKTPVSPNLIDIKTYAKTKQKSYDSGKDISSYNIDMQYQRAKNSCNTENISYIDMPQNQCLRKAKEEHNTFCFTRSDDQSFEFSDSLNSIDGEIKENKCKTSSKNFVSRQLGSKINKIKTKVTHKNALDSSTNKPRKGDNTSRKTDIVLMKKNMHKKMVVSDDQDEFFIHIPIKKQKNIYDCLSTKKEFKNNEKIMSSKSLTDSKASLLLKNTKMRNKTNKCSPSSINLQNNSFSTSNICSSSAILPKEDNSNKLNPNQKPDYLPLKNTFEKEISTTNSDESPPSTGHTPDKNKKTTNYNKDSHHQIINKSSPYSPSNINRLNMVNKFHEKTLKKFNLDYHNAKKLKDGTGYVITRPPKIFDEEYYERQENNNQELKPLINLISINTNTKINTKEKLVKFNLGSEMTSTLYGTSDLSSYNCPYNKNDETININTKENEALPETYLSKNNINCKEMMKMINLGNIMTQTLSNSMDTSHGNKYINLKSEDNPMKIVTTEDGQSNKIFILDSSKNIIKIPQNLLEDSNAAIILDNGFQENYVPKIPRASIVPLYQNETPSFGKPMIIQTPALVDVSKLNPQAFPTKSKKVSSNPVEIKMINNGLSRNETNDLNKKVIFVANPVAVENNKSASLKNTIIPLSSCNNEVGSLYHNQECVNNPKTIFIVSKDNNTTTTGVEILKGSDNFQLIKCNDVQQPNTEQKFSFSINKTSEPFYIYDSHMNAVPSNSVLGQGQKIIICPSSNKDMSQILAAVECISSPATNIQNLNTTTKHSQHYKNNHSSNDSRSLGGTPNSCKTPTNQNYMHSKEENNCKNKPSRPRKPCGIVPGLNSETE